MQRGTVAEHQNREHLAGFGNADEVRVKDQRLSLAGACLHFPDACVECEMFILQTDELALDPVCIAQRDEVNFVLVIEKSVEAASLLPGLRRN